MPSAVCWLGSSFLPNSSKSTGFGVLRFFCAAAMCDCTHLSRKPAVFSCGMSQLSGHACTVAKSTSLMFVLLTKSWPISTPHWPGLAESRSGVVVP